MKISVIIPCRNGRDFLGPTLDSLIHQMRPPDEVIFVDNNSTDGSLALAQSYGDLIRPISAPEHGASAARNAGVAEASGDAIMFLDADDLLGPGALKSLEAALERSPDAIACCPWHRLEEADGCWISAPASCAPRRAGQDDLSAWLTGWYHPPCSVLWSRSAYRRSGGWDADVKVNTDGDIMMRGFIAGNRLTPAPAGIAYYRRLPGGQVSLSGTRATRTGVEARLRVLRRVAEMLRAKGRLFRYRGTLGEAFSAVAADCRAAFPDLYEECRTAAEQYAGPPWRWRAHVLSARTGRKTAHIRARASRAMGPKPANAEVAAPPAPLLGRPAQPREERPKVSVVLPTFNRADILPTALDSALAQTYGNFEVIVIDDGSTDGTADLMRRYNDPRLRYLRQSENRGVGAARNLGIREAAGSLISFLDSDDAWRADKLERQVALFEERTGSTGLVYCGVETTDGRENSRIDLPVHRGYLHSRLLLSNVIVGGSCAMIRREVIPTVGYFDESLPAIEDYDFWVRIARFYSFDFVAEPLVRYFDRVSGDPEQDALRRSRNFVANFRARDMFYERYRHEMERAGVEHLFLMETARRHLRWPSGDRERGRRTMIRAVAIRPTEREAYPWLAYALLPEQTRPIAADALKRLGGLVSVERTSPAGESG
ncbi:MAG: glycosyltransferase [Rhodospirillaceae bacterium]